jgi:hypothetical protein
MPGTREKPHRAQRRAAAPLRAEHSRASRGGVSVLSHRLARRRRKTLRPPPPAVATSRLLEVMQAMTPRLAAPLGGVRRSSGSVQRKLQEASRPVWKESGCWSQRGALVRYRSRCAHERRGTCAGRSRRRTSREAIQHPAHARRYAEDFRSALVGGEPLRGCENAFAGQTLQDVIRECIPGCTLRLRPRPWVCRVRHA